MESLPMAPAACSLDPASLRAQLARYRRAGAGAITVQRTPRRLAIRLAGDAADEDIAELIAVERACCPFFRVDWTARERVLDISVTRPDEEPALEAIALALGLS
jgi:hypothetical protein